MATINKKFNIGLFIILTSIGTSRCLYDLIFYPHLATWGAWLMPRPQVFIDAHYALQKKIIVNKTNGEALTYNLTSENQWPIKTTFLIFAYTLIHCLDRPQLINKKICEDMIRYHFCNANSEKSVLKEEITQSKVASVRVMIGPNEQNLKSVREITCLD
ncbi:MAG: hypothetical protein WA160_05490 [Pseudobdellovibrio sp.]